VRYVFQSDGDASVLYRYNYLVSKMRTANLDLRTRLAILDCIAYKISDFSGDQVRISNHDRCDSGFQHQWHISGVRQRA